MATGARFACSIRHDLGRLGVKSAEMAGLQRLLTLEASRIAAIKQHERAIRDITAAREKASAVLADAADLEHEQIMRKVKSKLESSRANRKSVST